MITEDNCNELVTQRRPHQMGDTYSKAAAWSVVYDFCKQHGMKSEIRYSGIEQVIVFLQKRINERSEQKDTR